MTVALTHDLGRFVSNLRFSDLPKNVVDRVAVAFADSIAVTVAGAGEPAPRLLKSILASRGDEATLIGIGKRASALDAACINGTAAHALDFDDTAQRGGHISAVMVPAILAEAEVVGSSGQQMVTAYAAGFEAFSDVIARDPGQHHEKGWHPTGVFGTIAAAAACASLRRLDAGQAAMAIALSASQAGGVVANLGTMTKPFHAGNAARNGILSARLSEVGFTAAEDALEHAHGFLAAFSPGGAIDVETPVRAGEVWRICGDNPQSTKQYPLCHYTHRAIDGLLDLVRDTWICADEIERITVSMSERNATILRYHLPQTGLEAKFSIEFAVAATIIHGQPGLAELSDKFVLRPEVQELMKRVGVRRQKHDNPELPGYALYDQVVIEMRDGRNIETARVSRVRGGPYLRLSRDALWGKFRDCMSGTALLPRSGELFDSLLAIHELPHVTDIVRLLTDEKAAGPDT